MTNLFFGLYYNQEYFQIDNYDPNRYKDFWINRELENGGDFSFFENYFFEIYDSPSFGFMKKEIKKR